MDRHHRHHRPEMPLPLPLPLPPPQHQPPGPTSAPADVAASLGVGRGGRDGQRTRPSGPSEPSENAALSRQIWEVEERMELELRDWILGSSGNAGSAIGSASGDGGLSLSRKPGMGIRTELDRALLRAARSQLLSPQHATTTATMDPLDHQHGEYYPPLPNTEYPPDPYYAPFASPSTSIQQQQQQQQQQQLQQHNRTPGFVPIYTQHHGTPLSPITPLTPLAQQYPPYPHPASSSSSPQPLNQYPTSDGGDAEAEAELKRMRNTAASARFRAKKKQREQTLEMQAREKKEALEKLESRIRELEQENRFLKGLIMGPKAEELEELKRQRDEAIESDRKSLEHKDGVGTD
ncbi:regulatory protein cys-3 [Drepanopeziza brunnea f. sp. 'multigermtubi' MB_m1]|uniref:Regulatory protein cys-3 n=1 Tax=Marssonina brunnea f. sp. multigermtubi (strain MB_m1) TaxID=1072389 RepID=K1X399_MARBU|nr:regulatory protein cys-3 [Drepanopeziza brunnea f. sp. 'multigermtubi' MB_m1]EKD19502.1 regulatory protein cys-3 [Drepanopeziza brunnea f. sp. 'multigermtubi' MB_m1]